MRIIRVKNRISLGPTWCSRNTQTGIILLFCAFYSYYLLYLQLLASGENPNVATKKFNQWLEGTDIAYAPHQQKNKYQAGPLELYFRKNHYNASGIEGQIFFQRGCPIWREENASPKFRYLQNYVSELQDYMEAVDTFPNVSVDIRTQLLHHGPAARDKICSRVEVHPDGLLGIFSSGELSYSPVAGYLEPLLPPLRHPLLCYDNPNIYKYYLKAKRLLDLSYLVHDFGAMCQKILPSSRIVLIDMGASLQFHEAYSEKLPAVYLTDIFAKFGFPFDHIYAYEIEPTEPDIMVNSIPEHLRSAYHWINVGVNPDVKSINNPFNLVHNHFNADDIIIVKLDIDNSFIEQKFIEQLLEDSRFHASASRKTLIDHFYFEHHLDGTFERKESIELFTQLREKGIPAHYWV